MIPLRIDEEKFGPHSQSLPPAVRIAMWDFVEQAVNNPDSDDLEWEEKDGFRATQFTSAWVLYWEVIRPTPGFWEGPASRHAIAVKLWDVLPIEPNPAANPK